MQVGLRRAMKSGVYGYGEREAAADAARTRTLGFEGIQAKTSGAQPPSLADEASEESKR